jgi:dipeptidyl aminopeptidase/acylaminoacyl peptidase
MLASSLVIGRSRVADILLLIIFTFFPGASGIYAQDSNVRDVEVKSIQAASKPSRDPRIRQILSQLDDVRSPEQTAISPDGKWVAWTIDNDIELAALSDPSSTHKITACVNGQNGEEHQIAWAPDSHHFAFFSKCNSDHQQNIYVGELGSNDAPHRLVTLHGAADSVEWSPDGKQIAILYTEGIDQPKGWAEWGPKDPLSGVIGEDNLGIQRVAVVDINQGKLAQVTPPNLHVYEFDWSPASDTLVYTAAQPPGENNWWVAKLFTQHISQDQTQDTDNKGIASAPHILLDPNQSNSPLHGLQLAVPRWSPDGKQIAFIGGLMSDRGLTGGDIYLISSKGGNPVNVTPDRKASPAWFFWVNENALQISETVAGSSHLFIYDVNKRKEFETDNLTLAASIEPDAPRMQFSTSKDHQIALILTSFTSPPEVWAGRVQDLKRITHYNDALKPAWGKAESITWGNEGFDVQGWLIQPVNYDPTRKYPMVVIVHGGPAWAFSPRSSTV